MNVLYQIIRDQLLTFRKKELNNRHIIQIYWLTNMACKVVYIDNHYHVGTQKQMQYFMHFYNSIVISKVIDLENYVAYHHLNRRNTATSGSFVNSTMFDITTINTIRDVLKVYEHQTGDHVDLVKIPKISVNGMSI